MADGSTIVADWSGRLGVCSHRRAELLPRIGDFRTVCIETEGEEAADEKVGSDSKCNVPMFPMFYAFGINVHNVPVLCRRSRFTFIPLIHNISNSSSAEPYIVPDAMNEQDTCTTIVK